VVYLRSEAHDFNWEDFMDQLSGAESDIGFHIKIGGELQPEISKETIATRAHTDHSDEND
jgi:hypothetical protein